MKFLTYLSDLLPALESASPTSCMAPAKFIDSIHHQTSHEKSEEPRNQILLPKNCILLSWSPYAETKAKRGRLGNHPFDR